MAALFGAEMLHPFNRVFDFWIFHFNGADFIQESVKCFAPVFLGLFLAGWWCGFFINLLTGLASTAYFSTQMTQPGSTWGSAFTILTVSTLAVTIRSTKWTMYS